MVNELMKECAEALFDDKDTRIHTELWIFCGIALAFGIACMLARIPKSIIQHKKSKKL